MQTALKRCANAYYVPHNMAFCNIKGVKRIMFDLLQLISDLRILKNIENTEEL